MQVSCIENMALEKIKRKASDGTLNSNKKKKGTQLPQMDKSTADSLSGSQPANPIVIDITDDVSDGDSSAKSASGQANDELSQ